MSENQALQDTEEPNFFHLLTTDIYLHFNTLGQVVLLAATMLLIGIVALALCSVLHPVTIIPGLFFLVMFVACMAIVCMHTYQGQNELRAQWQAGQGPSWFQPRTLIQDFSLETLNQTPEDPLLI